MDWKEALSKLQSDAVTSPQEVGIDTPAEASKHKSSLAEMLKGVKVHYERKGRGGKEATILTNFKCDDNELKEIARTLKQKLGTGGSARGGEILLQGDCRTKLSELTGR